jgi:magnesium-transporting ATPase (P-type)
MNGFSVSHIWSHSAMSRQHHSDKSPRGGRDLWNKMSQCRKLQLSCGWIFSLSCIILFLAGWSYFTDLSSSFINPTAIVWIFMAYKGPSVKGVAQGDGGNFERPSERSLSHWEHPPKKELWDSHFPCPFCFLTDEMSSFCLNVDFIYYCCALWHL